MTTNIGNILFKEKSAFKQFKKLLQYGYVNGITSINLSPNFLKNEITGLYDNNTKAITIFIPLQMDELDDAKLITTLAHEIGHHFSLTFANDYEYLYHYFNIQYKAALSDKPIHPVEKALILEEELFAWESAKLILDELEIMKSVEKTFLEDFHYSYEHYLEIAENN